MSLKYENEYLFFDIILYKIINYLKNTVTFVEIPSIIQNFNDGDDIIGRCEIIYDLNYDIKKMKKINVSNKKFNKIKTTHILDMYNEQEIKNNKFSFETVTIKSMGEIFYNKKSMIAI